MKQEEAKFILRAYRCDKGHQNDALFADALAEANGDPALLKWLAQEQAFDAAIANQIEKVKPPDDLRSNILAGARASQSRPKTVRFPLWIVAGGIAAAMVIAFTLPSILPSRETAPGPEWTITALNPEHLAEFAAYNLANGPHRHVSDPAAINLERTLATSAEALPVMQGIDFASLATSGCQTFAVGEDQVVEVCFKRNGNWFHLYVARTDRAHPAGPTVAENAGVSVATWSDGANVFALATRAGRQAIEQVI